MIKKGDGKNAQTSNNMLLEHVFRNLHAPLYFYALKFVKNEEVSKDLIQDAFLNLLGSGSDIKNLKAYLFRTVRNNCLNYLRNNEVRYDYALEVQKRAIMEVKFYDTHNALVEKELMQKLNEEIEALPDNYKTVFKLSRFDELKNKEIAVKLGLPIRTVETQIYRALNLLRKKFKDQIISLFCIICSK